MIEGLQACLQDIESGIEPEAALAKFPALSAKLRPLIEVTLQAQAQSEAVSISGELQKSSLNRVLARARELRMPASTPALRVRRSMPRWVYALGTALFLLVIVTSSALAVSDQALPGDVLYPVKLAAENTRLVLTQKDADRLELQHQFDQERSKEVQHLILDQRPASVNMVGTLEETSPEVWKISGILVNVSQTGQLPLAQPGYEVVVIGQLLQDGSVRASSISLRIFKFSGTLTQMNAAHWTVGGIVVSVDSLTRITGSPQMGQIIQVEGVVTGDGRLAALALAASGDVVEHPDSPEPVFTRTSDDPGEDEPNTTEIHEVTEAPEPTGDEDSTEAPQPSETIEPGHTPEPTEAEEPSSTPRASETEDEHHTTRTPEPTEEGDD